MRAAARHRRIGPYQLQAAIAGVHAHAPDGDAVDWRAIVALYDALCALAPSPVAALNRAVAIAYADGPQAGSAALDALPASELDGYHLYHVARADVLRRCGDAAAARSAYERALARAQQPSEQTFLRARDRRPYVSALRAERANVAAVSVQSPTPRRRPSGAMNWTVVLWMTS